VVARADDVPALAEPRRAADAAHRLDDRAQHAAVQQAVRLQQLRRDDEGRTDLVGPTDDSSSPISRSKPSYEYSRVMRGTLARARRQPRRTPSGGGRELVGWRLVPGHPEVPQADLALVPQDVVTAAQQHEVVDRRRTAVGAADEVVGVAERGRHGAATGRAAEVARGEQSALGGGDGAGEALQ
jgi:hypothetical protein